MAFAQTLELFSRKRGTYTSGPNESITAYRLFRKGGQMMSDFLVKRPLYGLLAGAALMTACASTPQDVPNSGGSTGSGAGDVPITIPSIPPFESSGNASMDAWRDDFAARAMAAGRDPAIVHATLRNISPLDLYLGEDASVAKTDIADQAEFAKPIWDYVASAVTEGRKTRGADRLSELVATFDRIEAA